MACNKYYLILYSYNTNTAIQKFQFFVFMGNIMKNFWLKFRIYAKFRAKIIIYFEWMRNFVQNCFRIDTKMTRNFVQKKSFRTKPRNCCARKSTVSWKPIVLSLYNVILSKYYLQFICSHCLSYSGIFNNLLSINYTVISIS